MRSKNTVGDFAGGIPEDRKSLEMLKSRRGKKWSAPKVNEIYGSREIRNESPSGLSLINQIPTILP